MKLTTLLNTVASLTAGYVAGSAAGRSRYAQIKTATTKLVTHPKVQQAAFDLAEQAKNNAHRLPTPAANAVDRAATALQDKLTRSPDAVVDSAGVPDLTAAPEPTATVTTDVRNG